MDSSDDSKKNFFKHVFSFDDNTKSDMLNIIQYSLLAIIPVIILNKAMQKYVPEADEQKGNLEILAEIVIQIIIMFVGLSRINHVITFFPTYSGVDYPEFSIIFIVLAVLMITLSLQTKLGEKVSILTERLTELWEGKTDNKKKKGNVKVSQPISQNGQPTNQTAMNQAMYNDGTSINSLPTTDMSASVQQMPNYNAMHRQDTTPLIGAATPGDQQEGFNLPVAASDVLGGFGGFSSW
jgi:hypothetical protein